MNAILCDAEIGEIDAEANLRRLLAEVAVLAPVGEALAHYGADAKETGASFGIVAKNDGGIVKEIPDEEVFELVVVFFEIPCGLEMMIEEI